MSSSGGVYVYRARKPGARHGWSLNWTWGHSIVAVAAIVGVWLVTR